MRDPVLESCCLKIVERKGTGEELTVSLLELATSQMPQNYANETHEDGSGQKRRFRVDYILRLLPTPLGRSATTNLFFHSLINT